MSASLDPKRLQGLNQGVLETKNLMEGLAVDLQQLLAIASPSIQHQIDRELGILKRMKSVGQAGWQQLGSKGFDAWIKHPSDTVRGWACYMVGEMDADIITKLKHIKPLADDSHFGVREWAWIAIRNDILADLPAVIKWLSKEWVPHASANLRRFASEATRPRGVWCAHSDLLKKDPSLGLPIIEPLKADPEKYVQLSVANWLNDAGKSHPDWVKDLTQRWLKETKENAATQKIVKRGLRNLKKA